MSDEVSFEPKPAVSDKETEKTQASSYGAVHWEVKLTSFIFYAQEITLSVAPVVKCF